MQRKLTLDELVTAWRSDIERLDNEDPEKVAYDMVQRLVGSDSFNELYDNNELVAEAFDLVTSLELPMGTNEFGTQEEVNHAWNRVKVLVDKLHEIHSFNEE